MRRLSYLTAAALIALLLLPLAGCFFSREIANTRRDIQKAYPDLQLERQIVLNLGPLSLSTLGWMAGLANDDDVDMARRYVKDVRRVKVGVFRAEHPGALKELDFGRFGFEEGWEVAVKSRQDGERVWVLYRADAETVEDLYVVVLGDEELVVARLSGRLDRLVAGIMKDHGPLEEWVDASR
ncbi:MAG: DUF4252 domain-containing protein [Rhodothermales bacterium]